MKIMVFASVISLLVACGCKSVRFEYPNARCRVRKCDSNLHAVVKVNPIKDVRLDKTSSEGWSMLCELPLVPYVSFHNYDMRYSIATRTLLCNTRVTACLRCS